MFDARLYRAALVPAVLALVVAAFSLQNRPHAVGSSQPADAFDAKQAMTYLSDMAQRFPDRRPGSTGDEGLADYVAASLARPALGGERPFDVTKEHFDAQTIDGKRTLTNVVATRAGRPGPGLLVVAHRDAAQSGGAQAQLSATATLLELGRVFADGRLSRTTTLVSTSGGSGGNAGAGRLAQTVPGPIDAVLVLGDVAGQASARPMVVATSNGRGFAPLQLQRTVEQAVREEASVDPGELAASDQFARLALPFSPDEQGTLLKDGLPAVLLQVSGERGPAGENALAPGRLESFGRSALRAITALDSGPTLSGTAAPDLVVLDKVMPGWAVLLLVGSLLLAPLLLGIDGCARVRRRGGRVLAWVGWTTATALPFLLAAASIVLMAAGGVLTPRPGAPLLPGLVPVAAGPLLLVAFVFLLGWGLRFLIVRGLGIHGAALREDGAGPATLLVLAVTAAVLCVVNPYAAALIVIATHVWIPVLAPGVRVRRGLGFTLVVLALIPVVLVLLSLADQLGYGPGQFAWALVLAIGGGQPGVLMWILWSLVFGSTVAVAILSIRGQPDPQARPEVTVRGPLSYAGPGSLGGTSSGFRR
jgi:hypothetical protein